MSFLFFLMYAAAAGGVMALLESTPGCAQEFKIKVHQSDHFPCSLNSNFKTGGHTPCALEV